MSSLVAKTIERLQTKPSSGNSLEEGSPLQASMREVWESVKKDDFKGFAEAFHGVAEILKNME